MPKPLLVGAVSTVILVGVAAAAVEGLPAGRPLEVERIVRVIDGAAPPAPPKAPTPNAAPKAEKHQDATYAIRLLEDDDAETRFITITDCEDRKIALRDENGSGVIILDGSDVSEVVAILDAAEHAGGFGNHLVIDASDDKDGGAFAFFAGDDDDDRFVFRIDGKGGLFSGDFDSDIDLEISEAIGEAMESAAEAREEAAEEARDALAQAAEALEDAMSELSDERAELAERLREENVRVDVQEMERAMHELARAREELRRAEKRLHADSERMHREMERVHARVHREVHEEKHAAARAKAEEKIRKLEKKKTRIEACLGEDCKELERLRNSGADVSKEIARAIRKERIVIRDHGEEDRTFISINGLDAAELADFIDDLDDISDETRAKLKKKLGLEK